MFCDIPFSFFFYDCLSVSAISLSPGHLEADLLLAVSEVVQRITHWASRLMFSPAYIRDLLLKFISMPRMVSSNSFLTLSVVLHKHCFTSRIISSNCPPYQNALPTLKFHVFFCLLAFPNLC